MRKKTAILFILLFAFSQYAKQLRYLECTLSFTFLNTKTPPCDCIKTAGLDQADKHSDLPAHTHVKQYNEESVQLNKELKLPAPRTRSVKKKLTRYLAVLQTGNSPLPWHPPCLSYSLIAKDKQS